MARTGSVPSSSCVDARCCSPTPDAAKQMRHQLRNTTCPLASCSSLIFMVGSAGPGRRRTSCIASPSCSCCTSTVGASGGRGVGLKGDEDPAAGPPRMEWFHLRPLQEQPRRLSSKSCTRHSPEPSACVLARRAPTADCHNTVAP